MKSSLTSLFIIEKPLADRKPLSNFRQLESLWMHWKATGLLIFRTH